MSREIKFRAWGKNINEYLGNSSYGFNIAFFVILITSLIVLVDAIISLHREFEYTTASGETGIGRFCTTPYYGSARCIADDGAVVMVESYRIISPEEKKKDFKKLKKSLKVTEDSNNG